MMSQSLVGSGLCSQNPKISKGCIKFEKENMFNRVGSDMEVLVNVKNLSLCFSPVADTFFYLCGPGADLLVIVCLKYQTTSINLQRQRCFQINHPHYFNARI